MSDHPSDEMLPRTNIEVVEAIYAALASKDIAAIFELLDDSFVLDQDARLPYGGHYEGHDGFATFGLALTGAIDSVAPTEALYEADDDVVQFGFTRGTIVATGAPFDVAEVHRWKIRDGKA